MSSYYTLLSSIRSIKRKRKLFFLLKIRNEKHSLDSYAIKKKIISAN